MNTCVKLFSDLKNFKVKYLKYLPGTSFTIKNLEVAQFLGFPIVKGKYLKKT